MNMEWEADKKANAAKDVEDVIDAYNALKEEAEKRWEQNQQYHIAVERDQDKHIAELEKQHTIDDGLLAHHEGRMADLKAKLAAKDVIINAGGERILELFSDNERMVSTIAQFEVAFKRLKEEYCPLLDGEFSCGSPTACPKCLLNFKPPVDGKPAEAKGVLPTPETSGKKSKEESPRTT